MSEVIEVGSEWRGLDGKVRTALCVTFNADGVTMVTLNSGHRVSVTGLLSAFTRVEPAPVDDSALIGSEWKAGDGRIVRLAGTDGDLLRVVSDGWHATMWPRDAFFRSHTRVEPEPVDDEIPIGSKWTLANQPGPVVTVDSYDGNLVSAYDANGPRQTTWRDTFLGFYRRIDSPAKTPPSDHHDAYRKHYPAIFHPPESAAHQRIEEAAKSATPEPEPKMTRDELLAYAETLRPAYCGRRGWDRAMVAIISDDWRGDGGPIGLDRLPPDVAKQRMRNLAGLLALYAFAPGLAGDKP